MKSLADFVPRPGRPSEALIKKKFLRHETLELRLMTNSPFQCRQPGCISPALGARQRDVRTIRTILRSEPAGDGGCRHLLLERQQFLCGSNADEENSCSIEETKFLQFNRDGRSSHVPQSSDDAF